jgi:hypothetical protein
MLQLVAMHLGQGPRHKGWVEFAGEAVLLLSLFCMKNECVYSSEQ